MDNLTGRLSAVGGLHGEIVLDIYTKPEADAKFADKDDVYTKVQADEKFADKNNVYTKQETNSLLGEKADKSTTYTKTEVDSALSLKANSADVYTKTEADGLLSAKANKATTLAGYGITNAYTKTEVDSALSLKAPINSPTLTGVPKSPTPAVTDDSTQIATTAFVKDIVDYSETDSTVAYVKTTPNSIEKYAKLNMLGGRTVVWNQLANFGTITTSSTFPFTAGTQIVQNHKYYISAQFNTSISVNSLYVYLRSGGANQSLVGLGASPSKIFTAGYSGTSNGTTQTSVEGNFWLYTASSMQAGDSITNIMLIDLTLMYGSGNEPASVSAFEQDFPASYYAFNNGQLLSAGVTEVVSQGRNLLDSSQVVQGNWTVPTSTTNVHTDNYIAVLPNTTYYLKTISASGIYVQYYNIDKAESGGVTKYDSSGFSFVTNADTQYVRIMWYQVGGITPADIVNGSVCLSISSSTDGTYTPYKAPISYPIPASIQSLTGYGWSAGTAYNYIDYERKVFVQRVVKLSLAIADMDNNENYPGWIHSGIRAIIGAGFGKNITNSLNQMRNMNAISVNTQSNNDIIFLPRANYNNLTQSQWIAQYPNLVLDNYFELETPIETDISSYLDDANIQVEASGTLTFKNQHGDNYRIAIPSTIIYLGEKGNYASIVSPNFAGNPTVPTPASNDNSKAIANTAWVTDKVSALASDVYTKAETDNLLSAKADATNVYTKAEIDTELTPTVDGTWVKSSQTTAVNLQKLESGTEYLYALLSKQYDQLKKYVNGNYYDYDTDNDSKYTKTVPQGAMPYASLDSVGGKTVVWNQLIDANNGGSPNYCSRVVSDGVVTCTVLSLSQNVGCYFSGIQDGTHIILASAEVTIPHTASVRIGAGASSSLYTVNANTTTTISHIINKTSGSVVVYVDARSDYALNETFTFKLNVFDLTLMYGAGNEPTTVAEFQQQFPAQYYAFNQGTLLSAGVTEVVSKKEDTTELATYSIPASIQALEGYGWSAGNVREGEAYNYIDYERKVFVQNVGKVTVTSADVPAADSGYISSGVFASGDYAGHAYTSIRNFKYSTGGTFATLDRYVGYPAVADFCHEIHINDKGHISSQYRTYFIDIADRDTLLAKIGAGVDMYYELVTPVETDISAYLTDDNLIEVEPNGTLTFPNSNGDDYRIPIPSAETYMVDLQSAL